jgi:hypothetical protein
LPVLRLRSRFNFSFLNGFYTKALRQPFFWFLVLFMFCGLFPKATCGLITAREAKECSKHDQLPSTDAWARQVPLVPVELETAVNLLLVP